MFGPRLTRIFASRWAALWWAAGVLLLAWQVAGSGEGPVGADGSAPASAPMSAASTAPADPWALDRRQP